MKSGGKLPMNMMDMWKDKIFTAMRMIKRPLSKCSILPANSSLSLAANQPGSGGGHQYGVKDEWWGIRALHFTS